MYRVILALLVLAALSGVVAVRYDRPLQPGETALGVLRTTPDGTGDPGAVVTVTFDRPVAGGLDETVDAEDVFSISPSVAGKVEWRDPVTLRFIPDAPLRPGTRYTVSIANTFRAMDGARLPRTFRFTFAVERARVLTGDPVGPYQNPRYLPRTPRFRVFVSSDVPAAELATAGRIEVADSCGGGRVALRAAGLTRRRNADDPEWFRWTGSTGADSARDLRRVVELEPVKPLPAGCDAALVLPMGLDSVGAEAPSHHWLFATYGPLRVTQAGCPLGGGCHYGPAQVTFTTPVRGSEVARHVTLDGAPARVRDTAGTRTTWMLEGRLTPRRTYTVAIRAGLADEFGQRLGRDTSATFTTPPVPPSVIHSYGKMIVERDGFRTLAVQHVNVDTLLVDMAPIPVAMEARVLARWGGGGVVWDSVKHLAQQRRIPVRSEPDRSAITGVRLPTADARRGGDGTLMLVRVTHRVPPRADTTTATVDGVDTTAVTTTDTQQVPFALVQVTDLAVHARVGVDQAVVWVTGVRDGRPRGGVEVALHDTSGAVRARGRTDGRGVATLTDFRPPPPPPARDTAEGANPCYECSWNPLEGYVSARRGEDRAVVAISQYDPDLSPYELGAYTAWGEDRAPAAGAVFVERGIYRPGEPVYAKAVVRHGPLGALRPPAPGDSVRWRFTDREGKTLRETTQPLSRFGTAEQTLRLDGDAGLGHYAVEIQGKREGEWRTLSYASYQVAEYRPPEFLVDAATTPEPRFAGDTMRVTVGGRYLFGAPMAHAPVRWTARMRGVSGWEVEIPGLDGYQVGETSGWWGGDESGEATQVTSGTDSLDARGYADLRIPLEANPRGRPSRMTVTAEVADANRQTVADAATAIVHPADFYVGAKVEGDDWFWRAGQPVSVSLLAVRPDGRRVAGVAVSGIVVREEWHRVRRNRGGVMEEVGEWVSDTVARCRVTTAAQPQPCAFTPASGGVYRVELAAKDAKGRDVRTSLSRWAAGGDWVPWYDAGQFRMDVVADRERYEVGDTATILIASPFTDAEAWITVERERVLEQHRVRIRSGTHTLKLPLTEAYAPNAFVSVVVVRGRSARPGTVDDPGRPTMRVGYAELRVTPKVKRLAVEVAPLQPEYRPGDTARVRVRLRDAAGRPQAGEVTLWAVDEGVLSLTGYRTPDLVDLLYQPRGLGMRLASNLVSVAPQVPEGQKGARNPGGGGGDEAVGVLRSVFRTTAFFLGSVETGADGEAVVSGALPDNITTFRVMAVAVTAGDRYGSGEAPLLATKPLLARPALPRFLREGDEALAGVVVNHRFGAALNATVRAEATGVSVQGAAERTLPLAAGRGAEARFRFVAPRGDSATFRFRVAGGGEEDGVQVRIPIRPANRPVVQTASGMLRDTGSVEFIVSGATDPARSRLELGFGTSPLAMIEAFGRRLEVYPWACSEQLSSQVMPLIVQVRAGRATGQERPGARRRAQDVLRTLARRQRGDGGIGLWHASDWTSPWLTAYVGQVMLEGRAAGLEVSDTVLNAMAGYLQGALNDPSRIAPALPDRLRGGPLEITERMAAVDFLSRIGRPDVSAENVLLGQVSRMAWEDRVLLAEVVARRGARAQAKRLLDAAWAGVQVRGTRAYLPEGRFRDDFWFHSTVRPAALLMTATLAIDPGHRGLGPLAETLVRQGRDGVHRTWNTQDYGSAVLALVRFEETFRGAAERTVRVRGAGGRMVMETRARRGALRDSTAGVEGLLTTLPDGRKALRLRLEAPSAGAPVFYHLSVREVVGRTVLTPLDRGIAVERWYEEMGTRRPVTSVAEGDVVRVRIRVTVPEERQMVVVDDPLPAGLEAVDLSLRTVSPFAASLDEEAQGREQDTVLMDDEGSTGGWWYGSWSAGMWSPFDHSEIHDDRVVYFARTLWRGTYSATYLARATTAGRFVSAPAHAEEMYNPGVHGRTGGGTFTVRPSAP
jgi:uncharacterized protein YfaS (alpha-2-macroglobulin family)